MKDYLLFDLDGTLTDPKIGITTCVQYALASFGIEEPDLDKLEPFIGPPLLDSFMQFYGMSEEDGLKAVAKYRERFNDIGIFENQIYPGIPQMLKKLKTSGIHLAVASSKPTIFVQRILEYFHIEQYFDVVVGSELDGSRSKKSEVVQEALRQLFGSEAIQRDRVYMIGDTKFDVEGARECGVESVGVAYGYGGLEQLMEAHADYVVCSVDELRGFLLRTLRERKEEQQFTSSQRIWHLFYPFLVFVLIKMMTITILTILAIWLDGLLPRSLMNVLVVRTEDGLISDFTTNGSLLANMTAFLAAGACIFPRAQIAIAMAKESTKLLHLREEPASSYLLMAGATVGCILGINLLILLSGAMKLSPDYGVMVENNRHASFLLGLMYYCIVSPMAEELLFRGVLYNYLRRPDKTIRMGEEISQLITSAILLSAFLFSVYHMNAVQGIYAFVAGCLMAYAYEYFGDFLIPVAMHIFSNFLAWVLPMDRLNGGIGWAVCAGSLALMLLCLIGLHRRKQIVKLR